MAHTSVQKLQAIPGQFLYSPLTSRDGSRDPNVFLNELSISAKMVDLVNGIQAPSVNKMERQTIYLVSLLRFLFQKLSLFFSFALWEFDILNVNWSLFHKSATRVKPLNYLSQTTSSF